MVDLRKFDGRNYILYHSLRRKDPYKDIENNVYAFV